MARRYTGLLAQPIDPEEDIEAAYLARVRALAEWYGADLAAPGGDYKLAMALADAHVPGFKLKKLSVPQWETGPKRPGPVIAARDFQLVGEMTARIRKGKSQLGAAEIVVRKFPELGFRDPDAARQRYRILMGIDRDRHRARVNLQRLIQNLRRNNPGKL